MVIYTWSNENVVGYVITEGTPPRTEGPGGVDELGRPINPGNDYHPALMGIGLYSDSHALDRVTTATAIVFTDALTIALPDGRLAARSSR
jgi:hypothetical protein